MTSRLDCRRDERDRVGTGSQVEILKLKRGIFTFRMIEENGLLKVITISEAR